VYADGLVCADRPSTARHPVTESSTTSHRLLEEIGALAARFPVPQPSWHGYVSEMRACLADLAVALEVAEASPEAVALLERALDGELARPFDAGATGRLVEAYERLGRLPIPAGEHPYLDEIVPTLEAMEALLVCVSLVPAAARSFQRRSGQE
jgi:hypothetical protein